MVSGAHTFTPPGLINHVINIPINSIILKLSADSEETCNRLLACGIKTVRSIVNVVTGNWLTPQDVTLTIPEPPLRCPSLTSRTRPSPQELSKYALRKLSNLVWISWTNCHKRPSPGDLIVSSRANILHGRSGTKWTKPSNKANIWNYEQKVNHLDVPTTLYWHSQGVIDEKYHINWKAIYKLPASKKEGDTQFKLLHSALMSLLALHHCNSSISPACGWCGENGTLFHIFIRCPSIQPALKLL